MYLSKSDHNSSGSELSYNNYFNGIKGDEVRYSSMIVVKCNGNTNQNVTATRLCAEKKSLGINPGLKRKSDSFLEGEITWATNTR